MRGFSLTRPGRWVVVWSICVGLLGLAAAPADAADITATTSFATPGAYSFTVPPGVSSLEVTAIGAAGGSAAACTGGGGGQGATVTATIPVTAGESLAVTVGGVGDSPACGAGRAAGGFGGGGAGTAYGAGGGGSSSVVAGPGEPLVVAGGAGGGAYAPFTGGTGGNAGANGVSGGGAGTADGFGGGAGTSTGGGSGGGGNNFCGAGTPVPGSPGFAWTGGAGGGTFAGGGGGGLFGGGGGGSGTCDGGGGGGGASTVVTGATGVSGPTPTGAAAEVTLTYAAPTATLSTTSISFPGTVPQGTLTAAQELTVTNDGSAPLVVSGVALDGADPTDYVITNFCLEPVLVSSSCSIDVRFAPQAAGASTATLTVATNDPSTPTAVSLSGTGGNLPQGPQGPPGTAGSNGAQGSPGPQGKQGPAGEIELVSCTPEKLKIHQHEKTVNKCTTRRVSGTVTFTTTTADQASIARGHVLYATGDVIDEGQGRSELMLVPLRVLRPGAYTLTYHPQVGQRRVARHMQIIIR